MVVDNTACGPAIGGVRLAADVSLEEVFRLARAMMLKNAAAGLPHGMTGEQYRRYPKTLLMRQVAVDAHGKNNRSETPS